MSVHFKVELKSLPELRLKSKSIGSFINYVSLTMLVHLLTSFDGLWNLNWRSEVRRAGERLGGQDFESLEGRTETGDPL